MTRTTRAAAQPPAWRTPLIIAVVAVLAIGAGVLIALALGDSDEAASGSPTATPSASPTPTASDTPAPTESPEASPSPTAGETASPEPEPEPTEDPGATPVVEAPTAFLPPGSIVRTTGEGVRVRAQPSTSAEQVATLAGGELLGVGPGYLLEGFGPVEADGHAWYPVRVLARMELPALSEGPLVGETPGPMGWVAGEFVEAVDERCGDGDPDLETLSAQAPWERYACIGDGSITFEGTFGCPGCGGMRPGTFEPVWLAHPLDTGFISVDPAERIGPMSLRIPPDAEIPDGGSILRVTGHYADPAAADCVYEPAEGPQPSDPEAVELYCQIQFVVESHEVIGVDEDFPSS